MVPDELDASCPELRSGPRQGVGDARPRGPRVRRVRRCHGPRRPRMRRRHPPRRDRCVAVALAWRDVHAPRGRLRNRGGRTGEFVQPVPDRDAEWPEVARREHAPPLLSPRPRGRRRAGSRPCGCPAPYLGCGAGAGSGVAGGAETAKLRAPRPAWRETPATRPRASALPGTGRPNSVEVRAAAPRPGRHRRLPQRGASGSQRGLRGDTRCDGGRPCRGPALRGRRGCGGIGHRVGRGVRGRDRIPGADRVPGHYDILRRTGRSSTRTASPGCCSRRR